LTENQTNNIIILMPSPFSIVFQILLLSVIVSSVLVIIHAVLSAKALGGTLGQSLRKIAAGTIIHTILFVTYTLLEKGNRGVLNEEQIRLFFMFAGLFGSSLLFAGFLQLYNIAKKLRLFTV